jgi:hypothetical protein
MDFRSFVLAVACSALAVGCLGDNSEGDTQEIVDNLVQAGYPTAEIQLLDGKVYVGNDAEVSLQASREMMMADPGQEQYRTFNLVGFAPAAVAVCVNGAAFGHPVLNAAFNQAVANYNQLFNAGISRLFFFRVNGGPVPGCTFFINGFIQPGLVGGSSGFPGGGAPFPFIIIGDGVIPFGPAVAAHVITHEFGHTIGLRHSDFFNRAISCGGAPVNEEAPPSGLGAVLIPFTPAGAVFNGSLMNSCFNAGSNGLFTGTDITAIDVLY